MGFSEAVSSGFNNITNFEGRATRPQFWWFALAVGIGLFVIEVILSLVVKGWFGYLVWWVVWIVAVLAIVSAAVRRLHDAGQKGWLAVLWFLPCCLFLIPLYFAIQPSQGDNQYGPAATA